MRDLVNLRKREFYIQYLSLFNMIPKINYQIHKVLTQVFIPYDKNEQEFNKKSQKFIQHFKKIESEVLFLIEKFSGFKWSKSKIPVYIVPKGDWPSFTKSNLEKNTPGVVQAIYNTTQRSTHIFIHELAHVNQFQSNFHSKKNKVIWKGKELDRVMLEVCTDIVCLHVLRELFGKGSKYEKDYWYFLDHVMTSTPKKKMKVRPYLKKWDLNKKSLREYIFEKNSLSK